MRHAVASFIIAAFMGVAMAQDTGPLAGVDIGITKLSDDAAATAPVVSHNRVQRPASAQWALYLHEKNCTIEVPGFPQGQGFSTLTLIADIGARTANTRDLTAVFMWPDTTTDPNSQDGYRRPFRISGVRHHLANGNWVWLFDVERMRSALAHQGERLALYFELGVANSASPAYMQIDENTFSQGICYGWVDKRFNRVTTIGFNGRRPDRTCAIDFIFP